MTLDEHASTPLYRQVADDLRQRIHRRELPPGRRLPTEAGLMERYDVSRNTVRLALGVLRSERLVVTGQGRGSFVADVDASPADPEAGTPVRGATGPADGLLGSEVSRTPSLHTSAVEIRTSPATPDLARRLGLAAGDRVVVRHRVHHGPDAVSHCSDVYIDARVADDTPFVGSDLLRPGVIDLLAELGHPTARVADEVGVRMPMPREAQELQIATGVPVLILRRTAFAVDGTAVATGTATLPGDRHALHYDVDSNVMTAPPADGSGQA